jgi:hypothetical protein
MNWDNLKKVLDNIGLEAKELYKERLKAGAYATGNLYNSVEYRIDFTSEGANLSFIGLPDYYLNIENGRAAGKMPPIEVIQNWIIAKGIPDKPGLAFLIARSIGRDGIKPKPYLREVQGELINYTGAIEKAMAEDIKLNIKDKLKQNVNTSNNN